MFTLAHLSDPHLGLVAAPRLRELAGKRITGFINLARRRASNHQAWVLDALVSDLKAHRPDHIAVTGDLVNIALKSEFIRAREWLESLGPPEHVSLVPGNHDAYVELPLTAGMAQWEPYMCGDDHRHGVHFPYVRRRSHIAIIGVSTAITTAPLMATGRIGAVQLERLQQILRDMHNEQRVRIVLIHHPPVAGAASRHKRLVDAPAFRRIVAACGAELTLHGHNHTDTLATIPGPERAVPVIGVPSASSLGMHDDPPAQYNLLHIRPGAHGAACELIARRLNPQTRQFATAYTANLSSSDIIRHAAQLIDAIPATVT